MTVSESAASNFKRVEGDGATTEISFTFKVQSASDINVYQFVRATNTKGNALTSGITIALNADNVGGTVTFDTAPLSTEDVIIENQLALTQGARLPNETNFDERAVETALDRSRLIDIQQQEQMTRALTLELEDPLNVTGFTGLNIKAESSRAGKALAWNATADEIEAISLSTLVGSTNTLFTNLQTGDLQRYNGTNWVNVATLGTTNIADSAITTLKINDDAVTADKADTSVNAIGSIGGGTQDIDLDSGRWVSGTVDTSTTTFTFSNPKATANGDGFVLLLTNGGSQTVNWPAAVDWAGGTAPTLTTSGVDLLVFETFDGGTIWYGAVVGLDMQ